MDGMPNLAGKTVMIVDGDHALRMLIRRMPGRLTIGSPIEADGVEEALRRLERAPAPCDLAICDGNTPGMSGIGLFDRRRAFKPEPPFLMPTGRADAPSVVAAKRAGVPACIATPISPAELRTKLSYLLARSA
jgi:CheY-like chemotaxis protein